MERIESGTDRLERMSGGASAALPDLEASPLVERMTENGSARLRLGAQIAESAGRIARQGARLEALIDAQTDLARLRITAGIAGIYEPGAPTDLAALDTLADRYFFAFERVTELARMLDAARLLLQQVPQMSAPENVAAARADIAGSLQQAERRIGFLPSAARRGEARALLRLYAAATGAQGLVGLQSDRLALEASIAADSGRLQQAIRDLSGRARAAQGAVQAEAMAGIAAAERRASQMVLALLAAVAAAVGAAAILWLYARRQLVGRLADVSGRIVDVARGDYGAPMPISGHDEIGRMEKALNVLRRRARDADRLRAHLEEAVIARTGDVVAEMKASDAARAAAEAADRSKTEFLARMSHEIRTPLNGIIGMLGLLVDEVADDARRERVRTAHRSACELLGITNDILNYAGSLERTDGGDPVHFLLRDFVGDLGHQLQSLAAPKGLEAVVDLADGAPPVLFGDVVKIRQVVGNLISNAVKYTRSGSVTLMVDHAVSGETGQPVLSFTVSDTGTGMTREAVAKAFDAYTRADAARRAGIEGIGLGLAISRSLTRALGGALTVESEPGVGSRFTLTVPLAIGDPARLPEDEAGWSAPQAGRDVLVIDDHAVNRMVARGYLERMGCRVTEAASGTAGLRAEGAGRFDLVLIDLDLPDMDGAEVAARIGARTGAAGAPLLVALTAHLIDDTEEHRARLGVARILPKPLSPRALAEVLARPAAAPAPAPGGDALRASLRDDIADLGAETTELIVREFLDSLPAAVEALRTGPAAQQRKAAHKLRGAASNFRLDALCHALTRIEADGADPALARIDGLAQAAAAELAAAAAEAGLHVAPGSTKR